jgi:hypothetical protein
MSLRLKLVALALCVALTGCSRAKAPERGTRLASIARAARLKGQGSAQFSCPTPQAIILGDLGQATTYAAVALVEPVERVVSPNGGDDIRTWFKFRILEMLRDRRQAAMPLANVPAELTPVAPNEFLSWYCGGTITINGVQIVEEGPVVPDFQKGHAYLLWFELNKAGYGGLGWQDEGVFATEGDKVRPISTDGANSQFDRQLLTKVGTTLPDIRRYLAAHP